MLDGKVRVFVRENVFLFNQCHRDPPLSFSHGDESGVPCLWQGKMLF